MILDIPSKWHNCGSWYALTWRESLERMCCPCGNAHSTCLALCRHFIAFALFFVVVSFQDSLALEEPVKVLMVGLYISACRVVCGEVDWYKANFRL